MRENSRAMAIVGHFRAGFSLRLRACGLTAAIFVILAACAGCSPAPEPTTREPEIVFVISTSIPTLTPTPTQTSSPSPTLTPTRPAVMVPTFTPTRTITPTLITAVSADCPAQACKISPRDGMRQLLVPAGNFYMGSDPSSDGFAAANEMPLHRVYLDAYFVDETEVTNAMYRACVAAGACPAPASVYVNNGKTVVYYGSSTYADYPVVNISWADAVGYCTWASRQLPTEAQWEKAARGSSTLIYPWGNDARSVAGLAWFNQDKAAGLPQKVGSLQAGASPYGALDMAGNVFEWVSDWWMSDAYARYDGRANPTGPTEREQHDNQKVVRGGSWVIFEISKLRTTYRLANPASTRDGDNGFRCVQAGGG